MINALYWVVVHFYRTVMFDEHYHSLHMFFVPWLLLVLSKVRVIIRNEGREIRIAACST